MHDLEHLCKLRHPANKFPQGSNEFFEEEARLYGFESVRDYALYKKGFANCDVCGVSLGYSIETECATGNYLEYFYGENAGRINHGGENVIKKEVN